MNGIDATVEELDKVLQELHDVLQVIIEEPTVSERKKTEIASRPALKEARSKLSELRAEVRRIPDVSARMQYEGIYKDREIRLRNYVTSMKSYLFPTASVTTNSGDSAAAATPQTAAERRTAALMGEGGYRGEEFQTTEQVLTAARNVQEDAYAAIERTERIQYVSEQQGRQTLEQLRLQTERLYQIDEELEDIDGELDHATKDVQWFFRQLARDKCLLSLLGIFMLAFLILVFVMIWKKRS